VIAPWRKQMTKKRPSGSLVSRVLSNEDHYDNGVPTWQKAPTADDAKVARTKAAKRLKRFAQQFPGAEQLADIISGCAPGHRCLSGACPECGRAFQRWFVSEVNKLTHAKGDQLISVSIAFADYRVSEGKLHTLHTTSLKRALAYTLAKVPGISWAAGGIDLSLNDDSQKGLDVGWVPQFYGFVTPSTPSALAASLRERYPSSDQAPRPVQIKVSDGSLKALSYGFKSSFVNRIAYKDEDKGRWDTRKVSLPPKNDVQAMLWQHQIGFSGRLFLKNVRMTRVDQHVELIKIRQLK
jgi:hypothetical protein